MGKNSSSEKPENSAIKVVAAVIIRDGQVLIAKRRRKRGDRFGGRWEFPGGKIESGESPDESLRRELREELGVEVEVGDFLGAFPFRTTGLEIELLAFRTRLIRGEPCCRDHEELRWVDPGRLDVYNFMEPDRRIIKAVFAGDEAAEKSDEDQT